MALGTTAAAADNVCYLIVNQREKKEGQRDKGKEVINQRRIRVDRK